MFPALSICVYVTLKWPLFVKSPRPHCSFDQFWCSWHHSKRRLRWPGVNGIHRTGHANKAPLFNLLFMIKRDNGHPVIRYMCIAMSPSVFRLSLLTCRRSYQSSDVEVDRGQSLINPRIVVLIIWNALQTRDTILRTIPNFAATVVTLPPTNLPMLTLRVKSYWCRLQDY